MPWTNSPRSKQTLKMKTIVGVDNTGFYESALNLMARLRIASADVEVVHVDDSRMFGGHLEFGFASEVEVAQMDLDDSLLISAEVISKTL